ncbi:MAG: hypothetical protein E6R03_12400 [Hyphomicrobiaceae bacterium]|nr:MAG: hypothetical protein E6R03_12400 [Hyphomicrobiaceae bacterium]
MTKSSSAQPAPAKNNPDVYFGTMTLGCPHTRPDGTIVKVTMLDPRDPGFEAAALTQRVAKRAERGSERLLEALRRVRAA